MRVFSLRPGFIQIPILAVIAALVVTASATIYGQIVQEGRPLETVGTLNLIATPACTGTTPVVNLSWNQLPQETSYVVFRTPAGAYQPQSLGTPSTNQLIDREVMAGTSYIYTVEGQTTSVRSGFVAATALTVCGQTGQPPQPSPSPTPPASGVQPTPTPTPPVAGQTITLTAVPGCSTPPRQSTITLFWGPVTGENTYVILRSTGNTQELTSIGTQTDTSYAFTDFNVSPGQKYNYQVQGETTKAASNRVSATALTDCQPAGAVIPPQPTPTPTPTPIPPAAGVVPGAFYLLTPTAAATNVSANPSFDWVDAQRAESYWVYLGTTSGWLWGKQVTQSQAAWDNGAGWQTCTGCPSQSVPTNLTPGRWLWMVTAQNTAGQSWTQPSSFEVGQPAGAVIPPQPTPTPQPTTPATTAPGHFRYISPPRTDRPIVSNNPSFDWSESQGAQYYWIYVGQFAEINNEYLPNLINGGWFWAKKVTQSQAAWENGAGWQKVTDAAPDIPSVLPAGKWYWAIWAHNAAGSTIAENLIGYQAGEQFFYFRVGQPPTTAPSPTPTPAAGQPGQPPTTGGVGSGLIQGDVVDAAAWEDLQFARVYGDQADANIEGATVTLDNGQTTITEASFGSFHFWIPFSMEPRWRTLTITHPNYHTLQKIVLWSPIDGHDWAMHMGPIRMRSNAKPAHLTPAGPPPALPAPPAKFGHVSSASVRGQVVDAVTGEPISGVVIKTSPGWAALSMGGLEGDFGAAGANPGFAAINAYHCPGLSQRVVGQSLDPLVLMWQFPPTNCKIDLPQPDPNYQRPPRRYPLGPLDTAYEPAAVWVSTPPGGEQPFVVIAMKPLASQAQTQKQAQGGALQTIGKFVQDLFGGQDQTQPQIPSGGTAQSDELPGATNPYLVNEYTWCDGGQAKVQFVWYDSPNAVSQDLIYKTATEEEKTVTNVISLYTITVPNGLRIESWNVRANFAGGTSSLSDNGPWGGWHADTCRPGTEVTDQENPKVTSVDLESGQTIYGDHWIGVQASDNVKISHVALFVDEVDFEKPHDTDWYPDGGPYNLKLFASQLPAGQHRLVFYAFDETRNGSEPVTIDLETSPQGSLSLQTLTSICPQLNYSWGVPAIGNPYLKIYTDAALTQNVAEIYVRGLQSAIWDGGQTGTAYWAAIFSGQSDQLSNFVQSQCSQPRPGVGQGIPIRDTSVPVNRERVLARIRPIYEAQAEAVLDQVINTAVANGWNPAFIVALWIEESGGGGNIGGIYCSMSSIQAQLDCVFAGQVYPFLLTLGNNDFSRFASLWCSGGNGCYNNPNFLPVVQSVYRNITTF